MSSIALPLPSVRRRARTRGALRTALRLAATIGLVGAVIAWALLLRPQFLGGPAAYVMVSGMSMEPTLHNGDLVVAHRRDSYRVGDTVLYRVPKGETGAGSLIIHRIVGGSATSGWIVQGDNKDVPDLWRPRSSDVVGAMWASVPGAGTVLARAMSPFALASLSTLLAALIGLPGAAANRFDRRPLRRQASERDDSSSVPEAVLALTEPRPKSEPAAAEDGAPAEPSRALERYRMPVPTAAVAIRIPEIPRPAWTAQRLALPAGVSITEVGVVSRASWGEAAWTARDLELASAHSVG